MLILASGSEVRSKILRNAGIEHVVAISAADESSVLHESPIETAVGRARLKAAYVLGQHPDRVVLGVDQVCYDPQRPDVQWGKPPSPEAHVQRLLDARGREHALTTGFVLVSKGSEESGHATSLLRFRSDTTRAEIEAYVASGEGTHCAGGYAVEGAGGFLVERIEGCFYNVLGLPIFPVWSMLRSRGWRHGAVRENHER